MKIGTKINKTNTSRIILTKGLKVPCNENRILDETITRERKPISMLIIQNPLSAQSSFTEIESSTIRNKNDK